MRSSSLLLVVGNFARICACFNRQKNRTALPFSLYILALLLIIQYRTQLQVHVVDISLTIKIMLDNSFPQYDSYVTLKAVENHSTYYYSRGRSDRSGAVISDMLLAHAYCYAKNYTYVGACYETTHKDTRNLIPINQQLFKDLNLDSFLRFFRPCPNLTNPITNGTMKLLDMYQYRRSEYWTSDWIQYVRFQQEQNMRKRSRPDKFQKDDIRSDDVLVPKLAFARKHTDRIETSNNSVIVKNIIIFIRRGDITLCNPKVKDKYLPNVYYLDLLEQITNSGNHVTSRIFPRSDVDETPSPKFSLPSLLQGEQRNKRVSFNLTVHSEIKSLEPWDGFEKELKELASTAAFTYQLRLGGNQSLASIWLDVINNADVFVMSKSSFSTVPSLLLQAAAYDSTTPPIIIAPPLPDYPLPFWKFPYGESKQAKNFYRNKINSINDQLQEMLCPQN